MATVPNYRRIEKMIEDGEASYLPDDWEGKENLEHQKKLLDHMIIYILKLYFGFNFSDLLFEEAWNIKAKKALDDYAFWYAEDILDDLSICYAFENMIQDMKVEDYQKPEKMHEIYEMYRQQQQPSAFYKKIYEFIDECLREDENTLNFD
jgi:hypothetical protein